MHRVGCDPAQALALAQLVAAHDELQLSGVCTHFAVADEPENPYTAEQIELFEAVLELLRAHDIAPGVVHACNTAGAISTPGGAIRHGARRVSVCTGLLPHPRWRARSRSFPRSR